LVSCTYLNEYGEYGCDGGWTELAWLYTDENPLMTLEDWPYTDGTTGNTTVNPICNNGPSYFDEYGVVKANGFSYVSPWNPKQMTAALNLGPIAVAVDASSDAFQLYGSGVLTDAAACGTDLNHAVTLVGYNGVADPPYFILRNSWGTSWG